MSATTPPYPINTLIRSATADPMRIHKGYNMGSPMNI